MWIRGKNPRVQRKNQLGQKRCQLGQISIKSTAQPSRHRLQCCFLHEIDHNAADLMVYVVSAETQNWPQQPRNLQGEVPQGNGALGGDQGPFWAG